MRMNFRTPLASVVVASCICSPTFAFEFENGVPLTLGLQQGQSDINSAHINLNGHEVVIEVSLRNPTKQSQYVGFYATTPLFENLGDGEEYTDKTFSELKAFQDGNPIRVLSTQRAYFLGQDITPILRKAGVDPIPSNHGDWKKKEKLPFQQHIRIENWQGQVSFGWSAQIASKTTAIETIKFTALPQFGLETPDSESFSQLVRQHCGNPDEVKNLVHRVAPDASEIQVEVFQFPLPFLKGLDTGVTIEIPTKRWQRTRAIATLACGFDGQLAIPTKGTIRGANNSISILTVALLPSALDDDGAKR